MLQKPVTITHTVREWAELAEIDYYSMSARLRRGWSAEEAISRPLRHKGCGRKTHGLTHSKEYRAWKSMIYRCESRTYHAAHRYSGRGIAVCPEWRTSFEKFFAHVGPAPGPTFSLGRIDNDGDYRPGNVSWQTAKEQARNRAKPHLTTPARPF